MSTRSRPWCAPLYCACPALRELAVSDNEAEADIVHHAQWRPKARLAHAHHPIRHAQQVKAAEEAHVFLL